MGQKEAAAADPALACEQVGSTQEVGVHITVLYTSLMGDLQGMPSMPFVKVKVVTVAIVFSMFSL